MIHARSLTCPPSESYLFGKSIATYINVRIINLGWFFKPKIIYYFPVSNLVTVILYILWVSRQPCKGRTPVSLKERTLVWLNTLALFLSDNKGRVKFGSSETYSSHRRPYAFSVADTTNYHKFHGLRQQELIIVLEIRIPK